MHSMHNEEKSVPAERFIRTLKNKIYKYMTSILKNMYINKLDDMLNRYNTTYHNTIKMKAVDIKSRIYIYIYIFIYIYFIKISKYFSKRLSSKLVWKSVC